MQQHPPFIRIDDEPLREEEDGVIALGKRAWDAEGNAWRLIARAGGRGLWELAAEFPRAAPAAQTPDDATGDEVIHPPGLRRVTVRG